MHTRRPGRVVVLLAAAAFAGCGGGRTAPLTPAVTDPPPAVDETPAAAAPAPSTKPWPPTRRDDVVDEIHGVKVADPYRWLENVADPAVQRWMNEQDAYTRAQLAALPDREPLVARLRELFYYDSLGAPLHRKGRFFWTRKHVDKEKAVVYWKQGKQGAERVLFDPNTWSQDGSISLGGWWPSKDGRYVAYNVKKNNADEAVMHVLDVATGKELGDVLPGTAYTGASWTPDGKGFYYKPLPAVGGDVTIANRLGHAAVRYHTLGADPATDPVIREPTGDASKSAFAYVSEDGRWLIAGVSHGSSGSRTDVYFRDLKAKIPTWTTLIEGVEASTFADAWKGKLYVRSNLDAPRFRVFEVDPRRPARADWKEIVPEDPEATLDDVSLIGGHLVLSYLRKASSEIEVRTLRGKRVRRVALPGLGTVNAVVGQGDDDTAYLDYTSFTEPGVVLETSIKTGKVREYSRITLPFDAAPLVTEQVTYRSKDGTPVTMFLVHHKDVTPDGDNPTILWGYGGFTISITPTFAPSRIAWLERGGVYAFPNLRGGGEYGEEWHRAGMRLDKQNVFDDFISAGKYLIESGWTRPERLAIQGRSNGGLLVGAAMTQAPELFDAVVCGVPLLDMVRFHQFGLGRLWIGEYGSAEDPRQFAALHAYSPYHRVVDGTPYPAMLMLAADSDDRVDPLHARKFTAAVQAATSSTAPVLIRIERNSGHAGADLVKQSIEESADVFQFLWAQFADPT